MILELNSRHMNFAASFMKFMNKTIIDEMGNPISTIYYEVKIYPLKYSPPSIIYDYLDNEKSGKTEAIKEIKNLSQVEKLGYLLCSILPPQEWGWKERTKKALVLIKKGSIDERYAKKLTDMRKSIVYFDEANLKIKLISPRAGPNGEGPWLNI